MKSDNNAASGCVYGIIACVPVWVMILWQLWRVLR